MTALLEKAQALVPMRGVKSMDIQTSATLESALAELRRLLSRHDEIVAFNSAVIASLGQYGRRLQAARGELNVALRSFDLPRAQKAIENWVDIRSRAPIADEEFRGLTHLQTTGGDMAQFLAQHGGDAKRVLSAAYQASLAEANKKRDAVFASEQERLGETYDANDSPPVRRAKQLVTRRQHQLKQIAESPVGDVFVNFARQLLGQ